MRQSGILAAACIYALDHNVERLAEDHENARALAQELASVAGVSIDAAGVQTNIVMFDVPDAPALVERLSARVRLGALGPHRVRAVTHLDVNGEQVHEAAQAIAQALA